MGLIESIKDIANIIQKFGNIDLNNKILEIGSQALEQQEKLFKLEAENRELKEIRDISNKIERHNTLYLTLNDDPQKLPYCSHCWDAEQKLIQVEPRNNNEQYFCPHCKHMGYLNKIPRDMNYSQENYSYDPFKNL
jgi:hypothetical protein